jgi:hypothetical protein
LTFPAFRFFSASAILSSERVFEAIRQLFSREMEEIEDLVEGLLE